MAAAVFCIAACDSDLDIQTAYPFHVEEGRTDGTQYTIRWFLYDGKGTLKYNKKVLKANDRYPLLTSEFRLYYTSASSDSHSFIVVIEDNHGQSQQLEFKFNNEDEEKEAAEKGGQGIESRQ